MEFWSTPKSTESVRLSTCYVLNVRNSGVDRLRQPVRGLSYPLSMQESHFSRVWNDTRCPMDLKKKIAHTIIEEVIVKLSYDTNTLNFVIYWKGGCHTEFNLAKPRSAIHAKTSMEALDIIRKMSTHYGDDQIAAVLNKSGHRTGKGKRWNQERVATARRKYSISGQRRATKRPTVLTLSQAAKYCNVGQHTIQRMVETGLLKNHQTVPLTPSEIMKTDIDSPRIKEV